MTIYRHTSDSILPHNLNSSNVERSPYHTISVVTLWRLCVFGGGLMSLNFQRLFSKRVMQIVNEDSMTITSPPSSWMLAITGQKLYFLKSLSNLI